MKKLLLAGLVGVAGYLGYKKMQAAREEQDLWAEATDSVTPPQPATPSGASATPPPAAASATESIAPESTAY